MSACAESCLCILDKPCTPLERGMKINKTNEERPKGSYWLELIGNCVTGRISKQVSKDFIISFCFLFFFFWIKVCTVYVPFRCVFCQVRLKLLFVSLIFSLYLKLTVFLPIYSSLSCQRSLKCPSFFFFFFLSVIYELMPLTQSHFLFLHHHINKFIVLAQRYMCFFWFRSHLSLAYLKATQAHTLPVEFGS